MLRRSLMLTLAFGLVGSVSAQEPTVDLAGRFATIDNGIVRLRFDLRQGTYDVMDAATREIVLAHAYAWVGSATTRDAGLVRSARAEDFTDELGSGRRLRIDCRPAAGPEVVVAFALYPGRPFVTVRTGVLNPSEQPLRVREFGALADGAVWPRAGAKADLRILNAPSGATQTQVTDGPYGSSPNNLLLTFRQGGVRRSVVYGALRTREFVKSAAFVPIGGAAGARRRAIAEACPGARLVAYDDCGATGAPPTDVVTLKTVQGQPFAWLGPQADPIFTTIVFHNEKVVIAADGLDPAKSYILGFSWWDYDENGRVESVQAIGADGQVRTLVRGAKLPAFMRSGQSASERAVALPGDAYSDGRVQIAFTNDTPVPNAVVSEVWLYEADGGAAIPPDLAAGRPVRPAVSAAPALAQLSASDPVGKLVDPGARYMPEDSFYIDLITSDPFEAAEQYGLALRLANHARPNPYDFPTVCAWYAGVWDQPGAQNHPEKSRYLIATTPGLVEEADWANRSGFSRYSRAAGRLVPDNYTENNPQGWWDDEHWRQQGFYVAPYETTRKWGAAVQARGSLAFTYFQAPLLSKDFRESHRELLIGEDVANTLDYTKPETREYMRRVYGNMHGAVSGMMFDYCDEMWGNIASKGGFADPRVTATAFYRSFLQLAKDGLGRDSWIHERSILNPPADLALGIVDSQRTSGDTSRIDPAMVSRSGLRWYKNRVVLAYDMDSKQLGDAWQTSGYTGTREDGRRMTLTMAYVAASRLLLADSFRDMSPEELHDLSRTFPYPTAPKSARPIDAFVTDGWPRVYDLEITPEWHQVTLYNTTEPTVPLTLEVPLSGDRADGALGLDPGRSYYLYDFWNDVFVGEVPGTGKLTQQLRPGEARVLSVHAVEDHPQFLSTNRHIMQGYADMAAYPTWDGDSCELSGASRVVGGETYRVVIALNGYRVVGASAGCRIEASRDGKLAILSIDRPGNGTVHWKVQCGNRKPGTATCFARGEG